MTLTTSHSVTHMTRMKYLEENVLFHLHCLVRVFDDILLLGIPSYD
jgi:hypothetical protein